MGTRILSGVVLLTAIAPILLSGCLSAGGCGPAQPLSGDINNSTGARVTVRFVLTDSSSAVLTDRTEEIPARASIATGTLAIAEGRYHLTVDVDPARHAESELAVEPCAFGFVVAISETDISIAQAVAEG